jgi:hypothetical protein
MMFFQHRKALPQEGSAGQQEITVTQEQIAESYFS